VPAATAGAIAIAMPKAIIAIAGRARLRTFIAPVLSRDW
jgi:acetyl-CoA carboxylase beta subunit